MSIEENALDYVTFLEQGSDNIELPDPGKTGKARLSILLGPDEGRTYAVDDECLIGRSVDSTIRLRDGGVSRHHARVHESADGAFVIEDLGTRNGTWVDGVRTTRCELRAGAKIQLGPRCLLLFSLPDATEEARIAAQRLEIIGRLSAGINHDFNNLLCVILANAAYLLELPRGLSLNQADVRDCLEDMRAAAQVGADVTSRLATLAQSGALPQETVDLSKLCLETVEILRETFPKSIRVQADVQPGIEVRGIRAHLRHLLLNPCLNAGDAMPAGGTLSVELMLKTADELGTVPMMKSERYAVATFSDTGTGMPLDVLNSAFEPFFTTKEISLGRGLGLVAVRKVASDHGGTAELHSKVGEGTTLRVVLPVAQTEVAGSTREDAVRVERAPRAVGEASSSSPNTSRNTQRPRHSAKAERVLIAGDSEGLCRAFGRALHRAGYDHAWVSTAAEAVARLADGKAQYDVVLLDLDSPELAGLQHVVRELDPRVMLIGYATDADPSRARDAAPQGLDRVLSKPVDPAALVRAVARAIGTARRGSRI